jgi:hypothetical protein
MPKTCVCVCNSSPRRTAISPGLFENHFGVLFIFRLQQESLLVMLRHFVCSIPRPPVYYYIYGYLIGLSGDSLIDQPVVCI